MVDRVEIKQEATPADAPEQPLLGEEKSTDENTVTSTEDTSERPEWLPEKFKSAEDLAKAYEESQRKITELTQKEAPEGTTKEPAEAPSEDAAGEILANKGLDISTFSAEFAEKGELTPESYAQLEAVGIDKATVDSYVAGQKALADNLIKEVVGVVGSQDDYNNMMQWASKNLPQSEQEAFNKAIDGDISIAKLAVESLANKYKSSVGKQPKLLQGTENNSSSQDVYKDMYEVTADMKKPEYKKSAAFRAQVEAKLAKSKI